MDRENQHPIVERMHKIDAVLDEYESSTGIGKYHDAFPESESAERYLSMSRDAVEKMDIEECAAAAYILGSLSFHVQRTINREVSRVNWAKSNIKEIICSKSSSYTGAWSNQDMQATLDNDISRKLHEIEKYAQSRIDRLTYLSNSIKNMSDLFINLQRAKVASNG